VAVFVFNGSGNVAADRDDACVMTSQVGDISDSDASALKGLRVREVQPDQVGIGGWSELATAAGTLAISPLPDASCAVTWRSNSARSDVG
jgi:hypothetical protein